jgi:hypothetical protein
MTQDRHHHHGRRSWSGCWATMRRVGREKW